jgi:archaeal flagellar protein FlaI
MAETLSDRLRGLREAREADPDAMQRALDSKATLSQRMHAILEAEGGVAGAASGDEATAEDWIPVDEAGANAEVSAFARTLEELERAARRAHLMPDEDEAAEPESGLSGRSRVMRWFLGREEQVAGRGVVTAVPPAPEGWEEKSFRAIEAPYSFSRILHHAATGESLYEVLEPQLSGRERKVLAFVQDALVRGLSIDPGDLSVIERERYLLEGVRQVLRDYRIRIDTVSQARIEYFVRRDFLGYGPITALMVDPDIEDISCDGVGVGLFVFHRSRESLPTSVRFANDAELDGFVIRLAQRAGKAISISEPMLDAALPDGSRLQATLGKEVTQNGSTFTIRRFKPDPFTPLDLVRFGTMSLQMLAWFWLVVENGKSLIFSGGTASGKTTGLNAICQFIPAGAKVVSIEDTREVNLPHENWIKAVTRSGSSIEGSGEIGMFELLKAALRQRPEYILVGEVRGVEATVAFQAMATGHTVYSTMHADSARSVVYRLENDPINIPRLVLQALDVITIQSQARVKGQRVRRVKEVVELVGMDPATRELLTNTVFRWDAGTDTFDTLTRSYLLDQIAGDRNWPAGRMAQELARRTAILGVLIERGVTSVRELTDLVKAYARDPDAVAASLGVP